MNMSMGEVITITTPLRGEIDHNFDKLEIHQNFKISENFGMKFLDYELNNKNKKLLRLLQSFLDICDFIEYDIAGTKQQIVWIHLEETFNFE